MRALAFDRAATDSRASRVNLAVPKSAPGTVSINRHYAGVDPKE